MEFNSDLLRQKIAIVTGCSRGIGRAIAQTLSANGCIVYAVIRNKSAIDDIVSDSLIPCEFDVTNKDEIKNLILRIKKEHGHLDILVNNAGVMQDALIGMVTDNQIEQTFAVNVFAPMHFIQYATKLMQKQKSGSIINIASIMGISGNSAQMVYSASKGAVIALTKSVAKELGSYNIRVNAIAPGVIATDLLNGVPATKMEFFLSRIAKGELGTPQDVANIVTFLASDYSSYITGQIIGVDGMMSN